MFIYILIKVLFKKFIAIFFDSYLIYNYVYSKITFKVIISYILLKLFDNILINLIVILINEKNF